MKKLAFPVFALLLFGAACSSQTTLEAAADADTTAGEVAAAPQTDPVEQGSVTNDAAAQAEAQPDDATEASDSAEVSGDDQVDESTEAVTSAAASSALDAGDWCAMASQVESSFDATGFDAFADAGSIEEAFTNSTALINRAAEIAPPEIAGDVAAMAQATTAMLAMLEQAQWDFLAIDFDAFDEVAVGIEQAGYNVESYNFNVCGIGEDPDAVGSAFDDDVELDIDELLDSDVARDVMAQTLAGFGLEPDDAACVIEQWSELGLNDPTGMITGFQTCGVPLDALGG